VLNLFDISIRSSVSKNVVEKFGRPHWKHIQLKLLPWSAL
jgi:hypothetical protein